MQDIYDDNGDLYEVKLTKHLIAVIDILNTKDMMLGKDSGLHLNNFYTFFTSTHELIQEIYTNIVINTYSDNIVLAIDLDDCEDITKQIKLFLEFISIIIDHNIELYHSFMLRGSVLIGEAYITSYLCYGKGFFKAYELESNKAISPRIIVDDSITSIYKNPKLIKKDSDGYFFIDYLTACEFNKYVKKPGFYPQLNAHKTCFEENFQNYYKMFSNTEKEACYKKNVCEKLKWFKSYHNEFCDKFDIDSRYFIDIEL